MIIYNGEGRTGRLISLFTRPEVKMEMQQQWEIIKSKRKWYDGIGQWWERCAKKEIKKLFQQIGKERAQNWKVRLEFYYTCLYDLLQRPPSFPKLNVLIKKLKAQIIQLHQQQIQQLRVQIRDPSMPTDEPMTLYHITNDRRGGRLTSSQR